jgi:glycosyltransferase involved in cell wall biosynthesis
MGQMTSPKIALVHDFLFTYAGAERVLSALHALYPDAPIYTTFAYPRIIRQYFPHADIRTSYLQKSPLRRWPSALIAAYPRAVESFDLSGYDLVISSSGAFSHGVITGPETVHVSYCHSPMRYAWDWHAEYLAERGIRRWPALLLANQLMSRLRTWDAVAALRVDHWLANSQTVAARIHRYYRQPSTVIYPPVPVETIRAWQREMGERSAPADPPYAVTVSRLTPNKRIDVLIEAAGRLQVPLTVIGSGQDYGRLADVAGRLKAQVRFTGRVSDREKYRLVQDATCFLFAAEEDFGIAPVEALALGTPVVALRRGGATEYLEAGKNGYFFSEPQAEAVAESLTQALRHSWDRAEIAGTADRFSTRHFTEAIREYIDAIDRKRKPPP